MSLKSESRRNLLRADPYSIQDVWHTGKVHLSQEGEEVKTYCGKTVARCPGKWYLGTAGEVNCRGCPDITPSRGSWVEGGGSPACRIRGSNG
jgi:hypothetical protein